MKCALSLLNGAKMSVPTQVNLYSPLKGIFVNLSNVPDPVFAEKMVGDGFAIDPLDGTLYAPLDGTVKSIHRAKHAITIESEFGFDVLIHIGLESVSLNGQGFEVLVTEGQKIKAGQVLSKFDINFVAERIVTMITPILVTDIEEKNISIELLAHDELVDVGHPMMLVKLNVTTEDSVINENVVSVESSLITISNHHGIHARPAAQLSMIARKYPKSEILLIKGEESANVKSVVSLLSLSVQFQDQVKVLAKGENCDSAIAEIVAQINELHDDASEVIQTTSQAVDAKVENGQYFGVVASSGLAVGKFVRQNATEFNYAKENTDVQQELTKLDSAINKLINDIETGLNGLSHQDGAHKNILNAHLMILTDPELIDLAQSYVKTGASAAAAWDNATNVSCDRLLATKNQLLIERQSDFYDVRDRVLTELCGEDSKVSVTYDEEVILVAEDFTPSQIIELNDKVKGLVSVRGGVTSHVSILARTKGIPLLVGVASELLKEKAGKVILDTLNTATLSTIPSQVEIDTATNAVVKHAEDLWVAKQSSGKSATTQDGVQVNCLANIGSLSDAKIATSNGCDGVGLFRTEFMFLESKEAPSESQQYKEYVDINEALLHKSFVIRTLDVGGDKKISYIPQLHEENPMLGIRGVRLCLANRELFKTQLRAIIKTRAENIKIMVPMISKLTEYRAVKQLVEEVKSELGITTNIKLGIMVEVPSVAFMSEAFAKEVDFMSIGTNDLTQYVMAVDREHTELAKEIDHLHPAVISAIAATAKGAQKHSTELSVCGLMASERLAIPVLIGLGITNLSMTVSTIPENKAFIRTLDFKKCKEVAEHCLSLTTVIEVREYLKSQFN